MEPFGTIEAPVLENPNLSSDDKIVYAALTFVNPRTPERVCLRTGLSEQQVQASVKALQAEKYVWFEGDDLKVASLHGYTVEMEN